MGSGEQGLGRVPYPVLCLAFGTSTANRQEARAGGTVDKKKKSCFRELGLLIGIRSFVCFLRRKECYAASALGYSQLSLCRGGE